MCVWRWHMSRVIANIIQRDPQELCWSYHYDNSELDYKQLLRHPGLYLRCDSGNYWVECLLVDDSTKERSDNVVNLLLLITFVSRVTLAITITLQRQ